MNHGYLDGRRTVALGAVRRMAVGTVAKLAAVVLVAGLLNVVPRHPSAAASEEVAPDPTIGRVDGPTPPEPPEPPKEGWTTFTHWRMDNQGRRVAEIYATPEFRRDGEIWKHVDPRIKTVDGGLPLAADAALAPVRFGKDRDRIVELELAEGTVTLSSDDLDVGRPRLEDGRAVYRNVARDTDLRYRVSTAGLKEEIVLRSEDAPRTFRFRLDDPDGALGRLGRRDDGSWESSKDVTSGLRLVLPAPFAYELPDTATTPHAVDPTSASMTVVREGDGYDITVSLNDEWARGKRYPIVLDPTATFQNPAATTIETGYTSSGTGGNYALNESDVALVAGSTSTEVWRSFLRFDVSRIPFDSKVTQATLGLWDSACMWSCTGQTQVVEVHRMNGAWSQPSTWNQLAPITDGAVQASVTDPVNTYNNWHTFDLTGQVQRWISGTDANNGVALRAQDESLGRGGPYWYSSRHSDTGKRPYLQVVFTANASHGYPPAAPAVSGPWTFATSGDWPAVASPPRRSSYVGGDGSQTLFWQATSGTYDNTFQSFRTKAPFTTNTRATFASTSDMDAFGTVSDGSTVWRISDQLFGARVDRYTWNGTSWTEQGGVNAGSGTLGAAHAIGRDRRTGYIWIAYTSLDTFLNKHLYVNYSTDGGLTFPNEVDTGTVTGSPLNAQFVPVGTGSTVGLLYQLGSALNWKTNSSWTAAPTTIATVDGSAPDATWWQAAPLDDGRAVVVFSTAAAGMRSMRYSGSSWASTTTVETVHKRLSVAGDGTGVWLAYELGSPTITTALRRHDGTGWSAASSIGTGTIWPTLPERVSRDSVSVWSYNGASLQLDRLDNDAPTVSIAAPGDASNLSGTVTVSANAGDADLGAGGVARVDFYADRGNGWTSYLGSSTTPDGSGRFGYSWNTSETDTAWNPYGTGGRLWPEGAYQLYTVAWDLKGHSTESGRVTVSVVVNDFGLHPYRPVETAALGHGITAAVNMYTGASVVTQVDLTEPTVIGSLTLSRTYNSNDLTADHKVGRGWGLSVDVDVSQPFREVIDHSADPDYPSGTVELVDSKGGQHFYWTDGTNGYVPYFEDSARLDRNGDGSWSLTLIDGTRYGFRSDGKPASVTPPETGTGQSFTYAYDGSGLLTSVTEPTGRAVTLEYQSGRVWRVHDFDSARTWTYNYTTVSSKVYLTSVTDPAGHTTSYVYDGIYGHRLTKITDPKGEITEMSYPGGGYRVSSVRRKHNATYFSTTFDYSSATAPKVTGYRSQAGACPDSACKAYYTTTYTLDGNGRVVGVTRKLPNGSDVTKSIGWDEPSGLQGAARPRNLRTSETDFLGRRTSYVYDAVGNPVSSTDPAGNTTTHRWDEGYSGLVAEFFPNETFTPSSGFPVRRLDANLDFSYGSCGTPGTCSPHPSIPVDNWSARWNGYVNVPATGSWTFSASADDGKRVWVDGRLVIDRWGCCGTDTSPSLTLTAGLHEITAQYRETGGNASFQLSWTGPSTSTAVIPVGSFKPGLGLETSWSEPNGHAHMVTYDDPFRRHRTSESETNTDLNGVTTTIRTDFGYTDPSTGSLDAYGRLRKKTMPNGQGAATPDAYATVYDYYAPGAGAVDPCTGASANQGGLLKSETDGTAGAVTAVTHVYDARGNEVARTDGKGTTCKGYDASDLPTSVKAPDRATATTYAYDQNGNLTQVVDPVAGTSAYAYDDLGRLATAGDVFGGTTATYSYDAFTTTTQTITRTDGAGTRTETLDQLDRASAVSFLPSWGGGTDSYSFSYDANGDLLTRTFPGGVAETRTYDTARRLASLTQGAGGATDASYTETYDADSRRTAETGVQGRALYTYDPAGRLARAHDGLGYVRTYAYDRNTNRTQVSTAAGLHYGFDTGANPSLSPAVTPITFSDPDNGSTQVSLPFTFPFYGQSLTSLWVSVNGYVTTAQNTAPTPTLTTTAGIFPMNKDWALNAGGTVVTTVDNVLTPTVFAVTWNVSPASSGATTSPCCAFTLYLHSDGRVRFSYGSAFASAGSTVGASAGNGLDFVNVGPVEQRGVGRVLPGATTPAVTLTAHSAGSATATFDAVDRVTPDAAHTYDTSGNATLVGSSTFAYDGRHLLTGATSAAGTTTYTWDGEDREVAETTGATTTRIRYSNPGEDGADYETNTSGAVLRAYLVGPGGQLAEYTPSATTLDLPDPKGSIVLRRAANGDVTQSLYDEFGAWEGTLGSSQSPLVGYLGAYQKRQDRGSGVVLMGVRGYDPAQGRFLQRDPVDGGSANDYEYGYGDPVDNLDLDGRATNKNPCLSAKYAKRNPKRCKGFHGGGAVNLGFSPVDFLRTHHFERTKCWGSLAWLFSGRAGGSPQKAWPQVGAGTRCSLRPAGPRDLRPVDPEYA